jgi:enamine deaminase RidA (YjgF/YER057c/UK114 family)
MSRIIRTEASALFSRAVEYHGFVFTQGVVTRDPALDLAGQTRDILAQIDALLEQHGTDSTRLLQAQVWLKHIADREAFNAVWSAWVPEGQAPARALVQAELADPRWLVEIMVTTTK